MNYNRTYNLWDFPPYEKNSWESLYCDLQKHTLGFPQDFSKFYMKTYTARGVFLGIINPEADFEWTADLFDKINELSSDFYKY